MPGPVFVHMQTFSRKANPAGQSVAQVIGEATRDPAFSRHVEAPLPPRVLLGDLDGFADEHDAHVEARATRVKVKGRTLERAIRKDRHTLATIVASYPLTHEQIAQGGDEARAHLQVWEKATIDWARENYGDDLRVAFAHDDEPHPHLHLWLLPDQPDADATALHPGKLAKREAERRAKDEGRPAREAVREGNLALKAAMRSWIDGYYLDVGAPLGMTRDGPRRRRLTREQWRGELDAARVTAKAAEKAEAQAEAIHARAVARAEAEADAVRMKAASEARAASAAFAALAREIENGTLTVGGDGEPHVKDRAAFVGGGDEVVTAARVIAPLIEEARADRRAAAEAREAADVAQVTAVSLLTEMRALFRRLHEFLRRPDVSNDAREEATRILEDPSALPFAGKDSREDPGPGF